MIPAWYLQSAGPDALCLVFSHGNAEDIGMRLQYFREVAVILQCNVFCYEYTGYGQSSGVPTEESILACIEAAYKYVTNILGVRWDRIVLYGCSLGSATDARRDATRGGRTRLRPQRNPRVGSASAVG